MDFLSLLTTNLHFGQDRDMFSATSTFFTTLTKPTLPDYFIGWVQQLSYLYRQCGINPALCPHIEAVSLVRTPMKRQQLGT
jgi:hypothetical protein